METLKLTIPGEDNYQAQESFKFLRSRIQFCGQGIKTIVLTSCLENEGKSTISINVAKSLAEIDKKVLFIDADMRKSVMASRVFNCKRSMGLAEILAGLSTVSDAINKTNVPGLFVIMAGTYPPNPSELLSSVYFEKLIEESRSHFDYVIIDAPPLGLVTDAEIISNICDGNLLVIGRKKMPKALVCSVADQLKTTKSKCLGAIRNFDENGSSAGKYYGKRYGDYKYTSKKN